jgi:hypothetical protein
MKKITLVLIAAIIVLTAVFSGCAGNKSPTSPGSTGPVIIAMIAKQGTSGSFGISYSVGITNSLAVPVSGCAVDVSSANGTTTLAYDSFLGEYLYSSSDLSDYQPGQVYTVKINNNGTVYTASGNAAGGAAVSSDGNTVTWSSEGNQDYIAAFDPSYQSYQYGPDLASGFNLNTAGLYTHGSGGYTINTNIINAVTSPFSGAGLGTVLSLSEQSSFSVTKP